MDNERLGAGLIATIVAIAVALFVIPSAGPEVPAGDYVLTEGTLGGIEIEPGLALSSDGESVTGKTPCNSFDRKGFITLAGCVPALEWDEVRLMQTVGELPAIEGDTLTFTSDYGVLVYKRQP